MKKRILYIGNALSSKNATQTTIKNLTRLFIDEGFTVQVASSVKNKLFRLLHMLWTTLVSSRKTDVVLIDTYSTTNFWYAVCVGGLCQILQKPYIPILHGGNLPHRIKNSPKISKFLFNRAKVNVAPSHYLLSIFQAAGFTNLAYIPNTIEIARYPYKERTVLQPKLLWVRSFSEIYNPLMALQALRELLKQYPKATLTMVGPKKDQSYEQCLAFAKAQQLPVTFTGLLPKEKWISLAALHDIFISTTDFDNTPVSVIEAMALGLPVVSTNVGGMPFLIEDHKDGLLTPPKDFAAFVQCVSHLLDNPKKAQSIARHARIKAETFDWSTVKNSWHQLLS